MSHKETPMESFKEGGGDDLSFFSSSDSSLNDYDIEKIAGRGKFSTVYKATKKSNGATCALKKIALNVGNDLIVKKRVEDEIRLLQTMDHANIVKHRGVFMGAPGEVYIELEWADGGDLKSLLRRHRQIKAHFSEAIIWKFFLQMARGVEHMHERRVLHRDLKPANILVMRDGTIKVADLGLGREVNEVGGAFHSRVGTPLYMAPEVLKNEGYSWSSDVWSLGCLLYELANLFSPFRHDIFQQQQQLLRDDVSASVIQEEEDDITSLVARVSAAKFPSITDRVPYTDALRNMVTSILVADSSKRPSIHEIVRASEQQLELFRNAPPSDYNVAFSPAAATMSRSLPPLETIARQIESMAIKPLDLVQIYPTMKSMPRPRPVTIPGEGIILNGGAFVQPSPQSARLAQGSPKSGRVRRRRYSNENALIPSNLGNSAMVGGGAVMMRAPLHSPHSAFPALHLPYAPPGMAPPKGSPQSPRVHRLYEMNAQPTSGRVLIKRNMDSVFPLEGGRTPELAASHDSQPTSPFSARAIAAAAAQRTSASSSAGHRRSVSLISDYSPVDYSPSGVLTKSTSVEVGYSTGSGGGNVSDKEDDRLRSLNDGARDRGAFHKLSITTDRSKLTTNGAIAAATRDMDATALSPIVNEVVSGNSISKFLQAAGSTSTMDQDQSSRTFSQRRRARFVRAGSQTEEAASPNTETTVSTISPPVSATSALSGVSKDADTVGRSPGAGGLTLFQRREADKRPPLLQSNSFGGGGSLALDSFLPHNHAVALQSNALAPLKPNSFASQPNPFALQPNPFASQPNPFASQPNPFASQPNPFSTQAGNGGQGKITDDAQQGSSSANLARPPSTPSSPYKFTLWSNASANKRSQNDAGGLDSMSTATTSTGTATTSTGTATTSTGTATTLAGTATTSMTGTWSPTFSGAKPRLAQTVSSSSTDTEAAALATTAYDDMDETQHILGDVIGEGSFARVYRAVDMHTGSLIAVKQMHLDDVDSESASQMEKEIAMLQELSHPNLVKYLGTKRENGRLNVLLEYCSGGSISQMLRQFRRFPDRLIRVFTKQVVDALIYLHDKDIVHRDIKGGNVLVHGDGARGIVKLSDFGCSKRLGGNNQRMERSSRMKGTVLWMAPEAARQAADAGTASDIWSLGATVIEMATGTPPWTEEGLRGEIPALIRIATTSTPPTFPVALLSAPGLSFLKACMEVESGKRLSARQLAFHDFLTIEPVQSIHTAEVGRRPQIVGLTNAQVPKSPSGVGPASGMMKRGPELKKQKDEVLEVAAKRSILEAVMVFCFVPEALYVIDNQRDWDSVFTQDCEIVVPTITTLNVRGVPLAYTTNENARRVMKFHGLDAFRKYAAGQNPAHTKIFRTIEVRNTNELALVQNRTAMWKWDMAGCIEGEEGDKFVSGSASGAFDGFGRIKQIEFIWDVASFVDRLLIS